MSDPIVDWVLSSVSKIWPLSYLAALALTAVAVLLSAHVAMNKKDSRAAAGWIGLIWLSPVIGSLLYLLIGINRIYRQRVRLRRFKVRRLAATHPHMPPHPETVPDKLAAELTPLIRAGDRITGSPLSLGNAVSPLFCGDEAYPQMIHAIRGATRSVGLMTYIFQLDETGREFIEALDSAVKRGVEVRVLIDGVGADLGFFTVRRALRKLGIPTAVFLPARLLSGARGVNLRNHRKLLTIDGETAFTGGMNITENSRLLRNAKHPVADVHFRIKGPLVADLQAVFADDWYFATREVLDQFVWFPPVKEQGDVAGRAYIDGPDRERTRLPWLLLSAISQARHRIHIVTPYFLADRSILAALGAAALRGIDVQIYVPLKTDAPVVDWASRRILKSVTHSGVRVFLIAPPFEHTKITLIDDDWLCLGSSNWDARSFRLNFELNVELYDRVTSAALSTYLKTMKKRGAEFTVTLYKKSPFLSRLRDSLAWLLSPYL